MENSIQYENQIELRELFEALWRSKFLILTVVSLFTAFGVIYALSIPNVYKSSALLSPTFDESASPSGLASQLGGLASIAGINLSANEVSKTQIALHTLKGKSFLFYFINKYSLKPTLLASIGWDSMQDELLFDEKQFDVANNKWVREVSYPKTLIPSDLEAYNSFVTNNLRVNQDKETGLITITTSHFSPTVAKSIVDNLVLEINSVIKKDEISEANKSIIYLSNEIQKTNVVELKKLFYQLIEQQTQRVMLANVRDDFAFKVIDHAIEPEDKYKPKRAIIVAVFSFLGGFIAILFAILRYFKVKREI